MPILVTSEVVVTNVVVSGPVRGRTITTMCAICVVVRITFYSNRPGCSDHEDHGSSIFSTRAWWNEFEPTPSVRIQEQQRLNTVFGRLIQLPISDRSNSHVAAIVPTKRGETG